MSLKPGTPAPDFTLKDTSGNNLTLSLINKENQVVILFFPLAFSSVCSAELCSVRDNMKIYNSLNARVIGISVDSYFTLREFKKKENLNFTLLSDFNKKVSARYGSLYNQYFDMEGVSKRSVFLVGRDGLIKHSEILDESDNLPDFRALQRALLEK